MPEISQMLEETQRKVEKQTQKKGTSRRKNKKMPWELGEKHPETDENRVKKKAKTGGKRETANADEPKTTRKYEKAETEPHKESSTKTKTAKKSERGQLDSSIDNVKSFYSSVLKAGISVAEGKVIFCILKEASTYEDLYVNWVPMTIKEMAQELSVEESNILRSLKNLKTKNFIETSKDGKRNLYRLVRQF